MLSWLKWVGKLECNLPPQVQLITPDWEEWQIKLNLVGKCHMTRLAWNYGKSWRCLEPSSPWFWKCKKPFSTAFKSLVWGTGKNSIFLGMNFTKTGNLEVSGLVAFVSRGLESLLPSRAVDWKMPQVPFPVNHPQPLEPWFPFTGCTDYPPNALNLILLSGKPVPGSVMGVPARAPFHPYHPLSLAGTFLRARFVKSLKHQEQGFPL